MLSGQSGQAKNFITRSQAVRKLQISLPDFRRLCIFKGIYPREPRNKKKASKTSTPSTTFYYTKDIQYLLHEPLIHKFREHKAFAKKIKKSLGRNEVGDAARLERNTKPRISLDHIIKERYPTFIDALRDLDDALSLLFLFANLPSTPTVPPSRIRLCQRLCLEFEHYLIISRSLRKSFLSIKGIYYQATIQGQDIFWLVPYHFVQRITGDVDFRIMGTFVEFYTTLLGFVNYKLYTTIGLIYPPKFDPGKDEKGGDLSAFQLEENEIESNAQIYSSAKEHPSYYVHTQSENLKTISEDVQKQADAIAKLQDLEQSTNPEVQPAETVDVEAIDKFEVMGDGGDTLEQPRISDSEAGQLFAPYTFFLSREIPRQPVEFILRAFGCTRIGWDEVLGDGAFTHNEVEPSITHQIVDRPPLASLDEFNKPVNNLSDATPARKPEGKMPGRTYIQPQWVWDCINAEELLRPDLYAPGATLPPHLSPWVKPSKSAYNPTIPLAEQEFEGETERYSLEEAKQQELNGLAKAKKAEQSNIMTDESASNDNNLEIGLNNDRISGSDFDGFESESALSNFSPESEDDDNRKVLDQQELEAEAAGVPFPGSSLAKAGSIPLKGILKKQGENARKRAARNREEKEELERRKMMMSQKKRKLYEKMAYSNRQKDKEAENLRRKRRKLEQESR
ncbi:MAG: hypothetical protein Q9167_002037 [Letrouitia subvulpina]